MSEKKIEAMNIAFDFSKQYTVARVPADYENAEVFALDMVYWLKPYVAHKLNIDDRKVVLIAVSKNNKIVVLCDNCRYRDWLFRYFEVPSIGAAQLYDNVRPEQIIEKIDGLFS